MVTKEELLAEAEAKGIEGASALTKNELMAALEAADAAPAEPVVDDDPDQDEGVVEPLPNLNSFGPGAVPLEQR